MTLNEPGSLSPYRVAAIQFEPALLEKEANIARLVELTEEAAANGARLIVHPEMATTGYCWASRREIAPFVETIPGPTTDRFQAIAAKHRAYIVVALPEVVLATGVYYNSAALVGPDGVVGVYRKTHSYISEPKWAKDGDLGLPVFETELGTIGIAICMDGAYPETVRIPALLGADVVCFPTNWLSEHSPSGTWMARALESGVYFIAANRYGLERGVQFSGGSCVIDPNGLIQSMRDTGDGIAYGIVEPKRARDKRVSASGDEDKFVDRRTETYGDITLNTYRWQDRDFHGLYGLNPLPAGCRSQVAVCQMTPTPDSEANLSYIKRILEAEPAETDLVVFPELALSGPVSDRIVAESVVTPVPGPETDELAALAAATGKFIVAGLAEREGLNLFNTAVLVGPEGLIGSYRKVHLTTADKRWATPGDRGFPVFDIPAGRIGLLIGYDALFPEASTCLTLNGADLIAYPALVDGPLVRAMPATSVPLPDGTPTGADEAHFHLWRERARETNAYVAFANGAAPSMGWSGIFGAATEDSPQDQALVRSNEASIARLTIDTTNLETRYKTNPVRAKDLIAMRVPIWYDLLQTAQSSRSPVESAEAELASKSTAD